MPTQCSIPNCKRKYKNENYVSIFNFPRKEPLRSLWLKCIGREDFHPTKYSKICEKHFKPSDVIKETTFWDSKNQTWVTLVTKAALRKGALPLPSTKWDVLGAKRRKIQSSSDNLETPAESDTEGNPAIIHKHLETDNETDEIEMIERIDFINLTELEEKLHLFDLSDFWNIATGKKSLAFIHIKWIHGPKIHISVVIDEFLYVSVYHGDVEIKQTKTFSFPKRVRNIVELKLILNEAKENNFIEIETTRKLQLVEGLLDSVKENLKDRKVTISFLRDQVSLLTNKQKQYSPEMLMFATLLFSMAPHAYKFLMQCGNMILPELDIIKNLYIPLQASPNKDVPPIKFLKHAKERFSNLTDSDKRVVLQITETHLKPCLEVEGNIAGISVEVDDAATSVYVFMISSLCSNYKETVHLLPVQTLRVKEIHDAVKDVLIGLEYIGFHVSAVVTDDSLELKQVMSFFSEPPLLNSIVYKHPYDSSRPLFHIISFVHLLKNIRNDWLRQNDYGECIFYPSMGNETGVPSIKTASFATLQKLHDVESHSCLKYFRCFSLKAVSLSDTEKHNIDLVLEIFKDAVSDRLILYGEDYDLPHYQDTANFIKLICTWWSIVNPNSSCKKTNVKDQSLATTEISYDFLQKFLDWLDSWSNIKCGSGLLAKTYSELHLSTYALIELTAYCKNELGMDFILPGNIQMDYQIATFGFFRKLPTLEYFQKKQWPRIEPNLKTMDTLLLTLIVVDDVNLSELNHQQPLDLTESNEIVNTFIPMIITEEEIASNECNIPVLLYLAGHIIRFVVKELDCNSCKSCLSTNAEIALHPSVKELDTNEEPPKYPSRIAMNIVILCFTVLSKLCKEYASEFWTHANRNYLAYNLTINVLESTELGLDYQLCCRGHSLRQAVKMIVKSVVYNVLNNYDESWTSEL